MLPAFVLSDLRVGIGIQCSKIVIKGIRNSKPLTSRPANSGEKAPYRWLG